MKTMEEAKLKVVRLADNVITTSGGECFQPGIEPVNQKCEYMYSCNNQYGLSEGTCYGAYGLH